MTKALGEAATSCLSFVDVRDVIDDQEKGSEKSQKAQSLLRSAEVLLATPHDALKVIHEVQQLRWFQSSWVGSVHQQLSFFHTHVFMYPFL